MDFSVIIPAYNCEKTIAHTVDSIEAVHIDKMEIILIDDGSTDCTNKICKTLIDKYSNVKYYYQENAGVSAARNNGVQVADGKYILFLDSDDTVDYVILRKCMSKALELDVDMLIFGMAFRKVYNRKVFQVDNKQCDNEELIGRAQFAEKIAGLFDINYLSSACNKIYKKEICSKVKFNSKKKVFEDLLFVLEYWNDCNSVYIVPDIAYIYEIEVTTKKAKRIKCVDDFGKYMCEFQTAVLELERSLDTRLPELRNRIKNIYEWILISKLEYSGYHELKSYDSRKMRVSLFNEEYEVKSKINRLFFERRLLLLRAVCIYRSFRGSIIKRIKSIIY